jgi:large subunit ribosomal protein L4
VHVLSPDQLNTYDVLINDEVVFTADALQAFLAAPANTAPDKSKLSPTQEAAR